MVSSLDELKEMINEPSYLGGKKEGVVIKNYNMFTSEKKIAIAKFVSPEFKEVHEKEWGKSNPGKKDILEDITLRYRNENRWSKSVQHLRDDDVLSETPQDIGKLIKEVGDDIEKECREEILTILWSHFWPQIRRSVVRGLPEWYKEQLAENYMGVE